MTNIILCGGSGTRLWPLSRTLFPKQFIKFPFCKTTGSEEEKSLFQLTAERNNALCEKQYVITNIEHYFLALDQIKELGQLNTKYLLEPIGRNTAPAIALACFALNEEETVFVTPSDHLIRDIRQYHKAVKKAEHLAKKGFLVTFGIVPQYAETGFGYIESDGIEAKAFHEKPDIDTATKYIKAGNYYWNSGMFCFKAGTFLRELKRYTPDIYKSALAAYQKASKDDMIRIGHEEMLSIREESIDYAVMEKSSIVKMIPADIGWSDVGSFDALAQELPNDENRNLILADKPVELIDIEDSIVVDTADALLIAKKGSSQKVKEVVRRIEKESSKLTHIHLTGYRPWGSYTILDEDAGYKIKRIVVQPGKRLSLQKHYHRNEHWIVLSGSATVTVNDDVFIVGPNESTYIKAGDIHRLENRGDLPLVIIEVQVGEYTGEDDIVRIEDDYVRV